MDFSKFETNIEEKGKGGRAQHVNVIPSIDPSSNVTYRLKHVLAQESFLLNVTPQKFVMSRIDYSFCVTEFPKKLH